MKVEYVMTRGDWIALTFFNSQRQYRERIAALRGLYPALAALMYLVYALVLFAAFFGFTWFIDREFVVGPKPAFDHSVKVATRLTALALLTSVFFFRLGWPSNDRELKRKSRRHVDSMLKSGAINLDCRHQMELTVDSVVEITDLRWSVGGVDFHQNIETVFAWHAITNLTITRRFILFDVGSAGQGYVPVSAFASTEDHDAFVEFAKGHCSSEIIVDEEGSDANHEET